MYPIVKYQCHVCHKQFRCKQTLRRHQRAVLARFQRELVILECHLCHEQFRFERNLRRHFHQVHKLGAEAEASVNAKAEASANVGSVDESDDMHLARHAGPAGQNCIRCVVIRNKERLASIAPWASERPSHLGGPWGLGCHVCAAALNNPEEPARQGPAKWANFQVVELPTPRPWSRLVDRLRCHANKTVHQIAAHCDSDARPAAVAAPVQPTSQGEQSEPAAQGE